MIRRALAAAMTLLLLTGIAHADDASLGRVGESVQPVVHTHIRMVSEDVRVRVTPGRSFVHATFVFHNDGPDTTVLVGFPEDRAEHREGFGDDLELHDFRALVDGVEVPVEREPGLVPEVNPRGFDFPSWHTWDVSFAPGSDPDNRQHLLGEESAMVKRGGDGRIHPHDRCDLGRSDRRRCYHIRV